jgi:hypothetical protein
MNTIREHKAALMEILKTESLAADVRAWKWTVHFTDDRDPLTVSFSPEATCAEVLERYPDAAAAEPVPSPAHPSADALAADEESAIRAWLASIGETDPKIIEETIENCQRDAEARAFFLGRAGEPFDPEAFSERAAIGEFDGGLPSADAEALAWREDDRRRCAHCLNLMINGICKAATPGGTVSARKGYQPDSAILRRCHSYRPCPDDPDRRPGRDRWPRI